MSLLKVHPLVSFVYFVLLLVLLVGSFNPVMGGIALICGLSSMTAKGQWKNMKTVLFMALFAAVFLLGVQPLFSHNGITPLFYINGQAVTLETYVFGVAALLLLTGTVVWFWVFNEIFTQEKLLYLFGRITPRLALLVSMTLRLLPQLKRRYEEIGQARAFLGEEKGKVRETVIRLSTLTEWSLEASMETAQAMEARGYGKGRRSSFHLYRFRFRDGLTLTGIILCGGLCFACILAGKISVGFFPALALDSVVSPGTWQWFTYGLYLMFCSYGICRKRGI